MSEQDLRLTVTAEDRATPVLKNINREAQLLESHQKRFRDVIKQVGGDDPAWVRRLAEGKGLAEKISPILGGRSTQEIRDWAKEWLRAREALKDTEEATEDSGEAAKESVKKWGGLDHMFRLLRYRASSLVVGFVWAGVAMKTAMDFKRYGLDVAVATQETQEFAKATSTLREAWHSMMYVAAKPMVEKGGWFARLSDAMKDYAAEGMAALKVDEAMEKDKRGRPREPGWANLLPRWPGLPAMSERGRQIEEQKQEILRTGGWVSPPALEEKIAIAKLQVSWAQRYYDIHEKNLPRLMRMTDEYQAVLEKRAFELSDQEGTAAEIRHLQLREEIESVKELRRELGVLKAGGEEYGKLMPRAQYWATMLQGELRTPENLRAQKEVLTVQERLRDLAEQIAAKQIMGSKEYYEWMTKAEQHQQSMYRVQRAFFIREAFGASTEAMGRAGIGAGRLLELSGVGPKGYRAPSSAMAPISPAVGKITVAFDDMSSEGKEKLLREMSAFMLRLGRSATFH